MHTTPTRVLAGALLVGTLTFGSAATASRAAAQPTNADRDASATLAQDGATAFSSSVDVPAPDEGLPVFAHYMPTLPISLDNAPAADDYYTRNYLDQNGEGGKFFAIGGFLRDRPMPRPVLEGDWRQADLRHEVRDAAAAGISGFGVDILETSGPNWDRVKGLLEAASSEDGRFRILLQPDMTAQPGAMSPGDLAAKIAELASAGSVYRSARGRVVVSPFAAEVQSPAYWAQFEDSMASLGVPVDLLPIFVTVGDNIERYADVSYGMGEWGSRTPAVIDASPDYAARAHALGKLWVSPVAAQDSRPQSATYFETSNMGTLRSSWAKAIRTKADMALMVSWNDYSENSHVAPSIDHGYSLLGLNSYYLTQFRRGVVPSITRDGAYASFRIQPAGATPTAQSQVMRLSGVESSASTDWVEVETLLSAPAEVAVFTAGEWRYFHAEAGVTTRELPAGPGVVRLVVRRGNDTLIQEQSHQDVADQVAVQDLAYHVIGTAD